jgi:hypothetical protein
LEDLKTYIKSLTEYLIKEAEWELHPLPKLILKEDKENAKLVLGKTAHYQPTEKIVTIYKTNQHPKSILRSYCHEMFHHHQNNQNRLNNINTTNINEDDHLEEIERETYEQSGVWFRKWENQYGR